MERSAWCERVEEISSARSAEPDGRFRRDPWHDHPTGRCRPPGPCPGPCMDRRMSPFRTRYRRFIPRTSDDPPCGSIPHHRDEVPAGCCQATPGGSSQPARRCRPEEFPHERPCCRPGGIQRMHSPAGLLLLLRQPGAISSWKGGGRCGAECAAHGAGSGSGGRGKYLRAQTGCLPPNRKPAGCTFSRGRWHGEGPDAREA